MRPLSLALALLCSVVPVMAEDLTIVSKVIHNGGTPETSVSYVASDHIRMSQGDGNEMIVDLKKGEMTRIDTRKKTYYVVTRQDMDALAARVKEQMNSPEMQKAQEAMKNMPPDQRKQMDAMMGSAMTFHAEKTGVTRKVAGYKCDEWLVTMGQMSRTEECLTTEVQYPALAWEAYRDYAQKMQSSIAAMGPMAKSMTNAQEEFKKMKGFPLAHKTTVDVMGHKSVTSSEVTEIKRGSIPASAWEVPAGYTKVDNPMNKALQQHK